MKRNRVYLQHILDEIEFITGEVNKLTSETFIPYLPNFLYFINASVLINCFCELGAKFSFERRPAGNKNQTMRNLCK